MHSKVFVIARSKDEIEGIYDAIDIVDVVESINGCDYADVESEQEFMDSVESLKKVYGLKSLEFEEVEIDGEKKTVAKIKTQELLDGCERNKEKRIKKVKEALENKDLYSVAYWAYNMKGFYFYMKGMEFANEIDLVEFDFPEEIPHELYVIRTFDYHF